MSQAKTTWGTSWRQRLRLTPLSVALRLADALAPHWPARRPPREHPWPPGVTAIIPERGAPDLLMEALQALAAATSEMLEPLQVIVVANGAPASTYDEVHRAFPFVEWLHDEAPLGFAGAVQRGLAEARHGATLLLNNDMALAPTALLRLLALRGPRVFAVAAQIEQRSADGRREETGFTDWYVDRAGIHLYHAPPPHAPGPHLCAGGGATLFRTDLLRRYLPGSRAYDPFYWEDAEWSLRAWREGYSVQFCPEALARHRHRATTARFYAPEELARIVERNRLLFDARHGASPWPAAALLAHICEQPYATQRELARLACAAGVLRHRIARRRAPQPIAPPRITADVPGAAAALTSSWSFRLRTPSLGRRRVLFVAPFAVFPPRHGGARRVAEFVRGAQSANEVILVGDEASLYDARSFASFDGLAGVRLIGRDDRDQHAPPQDLGARMRAHCHPALVQAVNAAIADFAPDIVQIEHAELAPLVHACRTPTARWVLDLHDAYGPGDFRDTASAEAFARDLAAFDALVVCSAEDATLVSHPNCVVIGNGAALAFDRYRPSTSHRLLFIGPFRYEPNRVGIGTFIARAWPRIREAVPDATLTVLGGDEHVRWTRGNALFASPGVEVLAHRDDVPAQLDACALTLNPLVDIRGSAVKLVESLAAGRICVSTADGARGMPVTSPALVVVDDVDAMAAPIVSLLQDEERRQAQEEPDRGALTPFGWETAVAKQHALYDALSRPHPVP
ncbi:MAG: glycosyltransferase [Burkholderiales bacterium]